MGLRDEILNEKEQKQQAQKEAQKEADIKQKEQLAQDVEKAKKEYKELETSIKKGVVPEEWVKIYDDYIEKIKPKLKEQKSDSFSYDFKIKEEEYEKYFYNKNWKLSPYSKGKLLNKYLTERFKKEGFYSPKFEFVEDVKYYPTEAEQRAYDSAMKTYDSEYSRWLANEPSSSREVIAGEIVVRSNPYKKPKQPTLSRSVPEYHYYVKISGSLKPKFVKTMTAGQKRRYVSDLISGAIFLLTCFLIYWFLIR